MTDTPNPRECEAIAAVVEQLLGTTTAKATTERLERLVALDTRHREDRHPEVFLHWNPRQPRGAR